MKIQTVKQITQKTLIFALTLFAVVLANAADLIAQNNLDLAFGSGGKVTTDISGVDFGNGLALQPDGKLIVAGAANASTSPDFAVVRYDGNGSLDASFGSGGKVVTGFGGSDAAFAVALQPDGKIVAAGGSSLNFALARYNADGSLDSTFGSGGKTTTDFFGFFDSVGAVVIQPDGKIVAAGRVNPAATTGNFGLARYNPDGSLDAGFGNGGKVSTDFNGQFEFLFALVLQADGKLVAAGNSGSGSASDFALACYNSDGSLDSAFGSGGKVLTDFAGGFDGINSLVVQTDGKIVAGGSSSNDFALARYNSNGSLDTSFGSGGKVVTDFAGGFDVIARIVLQTNGKIVAAGQVSISGTNDFGLARYNTNGSLDTTFGAGGKITTDFGNGDSALGVVIQPDGKIVAAGYTANTNFTAADFALARYLGDLVVARRTLFDFDGDGKADVSVFRQGSWYWLQSSDNAFRAVQFGQAGDKPVPADYDGDSKTDVAVFRDGYWFILQSSNNIFRAVLFGVSSDTPVPGDYDGDGSADTTVFRAGFWYVLNSANNSFRAEQFGAASDKPIVGDFDGDRKNDLAVFRDGSWFIQKSSQGFFGQQFGTGGDKPVPADYDGDGQTDLAVFRQGTWYLQQSTAGFAVVNFGIATDRPAAADYDGDGRADVAVFRDGNWFILQSANNQLRAVQFGSAGDMPVPSAFVP